MIRGCKEDQRRRGNVSKGMAREREYLPNISDDLRAILKLGDANQTERANATTSTTPPANTTHHHHHHHHHHGHKEYPSYPGYYGGYPQNIHHVDLTTAQPYSQISYNPYEQPANFYHDDRYNAYPGLNPSFSVPYPSDQISEFAGTDFNRLYPSGYQLPNISDGFKPV